MHHDINCQFIGDQRRHSLTGQKRATVPVEPVSPIKAVKRRTGQNLFRIDAQGHWDRDSNTLKLTEFYKFDDGYHDPLDWSIAKRSDEQYEGFEASIEGSGAGEQRGNAFHWPYSRNVPDKEGHTSSLVFDDWFWLIEPNVLSASASITKLGIEVARLSGFYTRSLAEKLYRLRARALTQ